MKKKFIVSTIILLTILVVYLLGPKPKTPVYSNSLPTLDASIDEINEYVDQREAKLDLKKDNNAKIIWADSIGKPTEYVILYIPGFSATRMEGDPVHRNVAQHFGANLFSFATGLSWIQKQHI